MSHAHSESHYGEPGAQHEPLPLDPEHDIDAKSATWWVVGGAIVLFISLWLMLPIFVRVLQVEHDEKVSLAPTVERHDVEEAEHEFLNGTNPTKKKIDDVVRGLRKK